jgi:hypothetical protein
VALLAAALLVAGLAAAQLLGGGGTRTVTGIVVKVEAASAVEVRGFTLRTSDGQLLAFTVGRLDLSGDAFPAEHLREHMATAAPVKVTYTQQGGSLVASRLEDGEATPSGSG